MATKRAPKPEAKPASDEESEYAESSASEIPDPDDSEDEETQNEPDEDILETGLRRFKLCEDAESTQRALEVDDAKFLAGDQWPVEVKSQRGIDGRPCLIINRLPQVVNQITNEQRQNRPATKVFPLGDGASDEIAKIRQGMIRDIEVRSYSDIAYDRAFYSCVSRGRGYYRLYPDYCDAQSFDLEPKFGSIDNSHSVYLDPDSREPDGSDAKYGFITSDFTEDGFKAAYPKAKLSAINEWQSYANSAPGWISDRACRVAEYFYIDYKPATLLKLKNGNTLVKEDLEDAQLEQLEQAGQIVDERDTKLPLVYWCKINGVEILEKTELPGPYIPIFPVYGTENVIDGKRTWEGIIRHAKDPQRMYNYWASAETEAIALAPKAPWLVAEGQLEGYEKMWELSNRRNFAYLPYKLKTFNGVAAPPPQRVFGEPNVQAITQARMASDEDLKATTGVYNDQVGNKSNDVSGIAVENRVRQAQTTNYHFVDNLTRTIRHSGRVCNIWLTYYYDTARAVRILHPDGSDEMVMINQMFNHKGKQVNYDMASGRYDVGTEAGPTYQSSRQEARQSLLDLYRVLPQAAQVSGDLFVKNQDWPGKDEVAQRLKKMLPPGMADDDKNSPIPPQAKQMMDQMNATIQQLTQHLNVAHDELDKKKLELESRERIALMQQQTQLQIALMKTNSTEAIEGFRQEIAQIDRRLGLLNLGQSIDQEMNPTGGVTPGQIPTGGQPGQPSTGGVPPGQPMGG